MAGRGLRNEEEARSPEENKAVVRRVVEEVFNQGHLAAGDPFLAAAYRDANALPGQEPGRAGATRAFTLSRAVFPDLRDTIEEMIAEGDTVVTRLTCRATPQGALLGVPPKRGVVPAADQAVG
jgi:predicted ester cyclase